MTKLEENNINTQIDLIRDILSNFNGIEYTFLENGKNLLSMTRTAVFNKENNSYSLDKEIFEKIMDLGYNLQDKHKWPNLGILNKTAVPDNELKIKILRNLQKL